MSTGDSSSTEAKLARLKEILSEVGGAVVAFSGGVGSSLLVTVAHEVMGDRLVSRIPYGEPLEDGTLRRIDEAMWFLCGPGYDLAVGVGATGTRGSINRRPRTHPASAASSGWVPPLPLSCLAKLAPVRYNDPRVGLPTRSDRLRLRAGRE